MGHALFVCGQHSSLCKFRSAGVLVIGGGGHADRAATGPVVLLMCALAILLLLSVRSPVSCGGVFLWFGVLPTCMVSALCCAGLATVCLQAFVAGVRAMVVGYPLPLVEGVVLLPRRGLVPREFRWGVTGIGADRLDANSARPPRGSSLQLLHCRVVLGIYLLRHRPHQAPPKEWILHLCS